MDNTITFELPINEYNVDSSFNNHEGLESVQVWGYNEEGPISLLNYNRSCDPSDMTYHTTLAFPGCVESHFQNDLSINKIEFVRESDNPTMKMEFHAKTLSDIEAIRDGIKDCVFKID